MSDKLFLQPCPLCGHEPHPVYAKHGYTWCENEKCALYDISIWSEQWNTRATSPAERQIEAIRAAVARYRRCIDLGGGGSRLAREIEEALGISTVEEEE